MQGVGVRIVVCALVASLAVPAALLAGGDEASTPASEPPAAGAAGGSELAPARDHESTATPDPESEATPVQGLSGEDELPAAPEPDATSDGSQDYGVAKEPGGDRRTKQGGKRTARAAATRTVRMQDIEFRPRNIRIDRGDTVRWENRDEARHDAVGRNGSFKTRVIGKGETAQHTFGRSGEFRYFCSLHVGMTGTVTVSGSGGGGSGGGGSGGGGSGGGSDSSSGGAVGGSSSSVGSLGSSGFGSSGSSAFGSSGSSSSLPHTGLELLWLLVTGGSLVALGGGLKLAAARIR